MRRIRQKSQTTRIFPVFLAFITVCLVVFIFVEDPLNRQRSGKEMEILDFANKNGISLSEYPDNLIALYERNEETKQFVFEYPLRKDNNPEIDLSETDLETVPLFMQWDQRWGYFAYGNSIIGLNGCGPVCLSMVAMYITKNTEMNPKWMADFSSANGYYIKDNGTAWTLMSEGAEKLGITATELPLEESIIIRELTAGHPIICIMGEGDFTKEGHYIVLTGYENGKITVNDPNSYKNSEKLWDYKDIKDQIRNLWAYST